RPTPSTTPKPSGPNSTPRPGSTPSTHPQPQRIDYKALVDVSVATPRLGQTVDLTARIAPNKGDFDAPGFTIVRPGVPRGARMPAQNPSPAVFKASYAFLEAGRFEITFTTQEDGRPISAKRSVTASSPTPTPTAPTPTPTAPTPSPPGSVKWM